MKNKKRLANKIVELLGGKDNIQDYFHCVTRLRFYLKDSNQVDIKKLKQLEGVMGAQYKTEQLQIIIGNDVEEVFLEIKKIIGNISSSKETSINKNHKSFSVKLIFETLASIFLPVVPVLAGTGMIKGFLIIINTYTSISSKNGVIQVMTIASDTVFYFFPFLIAWSAAKRFKTDIPISMALAGCLLYPIMVNGVESGEKGLDFLGLTVPFVQYSSTSIPIILAVWFLSYLYPLIEKIITKSLRLVLVPLLTMVIMTPVTLIGIAPLANYVSQGVAGVIKFLFDFSPMLAGLIVGATRPLVVLSGMHLSLGAIIVENIRTYGQDFILPVNTMGTLAMTGAALGTWYKSKNKKTKTISLSAFISGVIGVTEPVIYGVLIKFKNALIATMIGGGVAGAFVAYFKGSSSAYVNSSILSLPVFVGPGFNAILIGLVIAFIISFIMVQILGISEEKNEHIKLNSDKNSVVNSPLSGEILKRENIKDDVFSKKLIGNGIAIKPSSKKVVSPCNGVINNIYPTKHAIGMISDEGVEILLHIGINTVNLKGKYFDIKVLEGDVVKNGELIANVDFKNIEKEGYSSISPIIILNSKEYLDIIPVSIKGKIDFNDELLQLIK